jgi:hypothetical protein
MTVGNVTATGKSNPITANDSNPVSVSNSTVYSKQPNGSFYDKATQFFEKNPSATIYRDGNRTVRLTTLSSENNPTSVSSRIRLDVETNTPSGILKDSNEFLRVDFKKMIITGWSFGTEITPIRNVTILKYDRITIN